MRETQPASMASAATASSAAARAAGELATGESDADRADSEATSEIFRRVGLCSESSDEGREASSHDFSSEAERIVRRSSVAYWKPHCYVISEVGR